MARVISNIIGIGGEKSRRFSSLSVSMVLLALNTGILYQLLYQMLLISML